MLMGETTGLVFQLMIIPLLAPQITADHHQISTSFWAPVKEGSILGRAGTIQEVTGTGEDRLTNDLSRPDILTLLKVI